MTPSGRNTGAAANKEGRETRSGVFAAAPSGLVIGTPPHAGVGKAAAWSNRANRTDDMVAPWDDWDIVANEYDATCGMRPVAEFAAELLVAVFAELVAVDAALETHGWPGKEIAEEAFSAFCHLADGFNAAAHTYLAAIGVHRLHNNSRPIIRTGELLTERDDSWFAEVDTEPTPAILPQDVQDNSAALEAIALKDAKTDTKVALNNAVMAEMGKVVEGTNRCLKVAECFLQARGLEVYLCHRTNTAGIVVGASLVSGDPVRPVFRMADLERFLTGIGGKAETPEPKPAAAKPYIPPPATSPRPGYPAWLVREYAGTALETL